MSAQTNAAPVIIKRKKVVAGGGHHGGAWKVAIYLRSLSLRRFAPVSQSAPRGPGTASTVILTLAGTGMTAGAAPPSWMQGHHDEKTLMET